MFSRRLITVACIAGAGSAAALLAATTLPVSAQSPRPFLTAAQCQPLTEENYEMCCIAINRSSILSDDELGMCPPITTSLIQNILTTDNDGGGFIVNGGNGGDGNGGNGDDGDNGDGGNGNGNVDGSGSGGGGGGGGGGSSGGGGGGGGGSSGGGGGGGG